MVALRGAKFQLKRAIKGHSDPSETTIKQTIMSQSNTSIPARLIHLADVSFDRASQPMLQSSLDELQLSESRFDALVVTGNIAATVDANTYQAFAETISDEGVPVYGLPGKQDDAGLFANAIDDNNLHLDSVIEIGGWTILFLDRILGAGLTHVTVAHMEKIAALLDSKPDSPVLVFSRHYKLDDSQAEQVSMESLRELQLVLELLSSRPQVKALVCCHAYVSTYEDKVSGLTLLATPPACAVDGEADDSGYRRLDLYPDGRLLSQVVQHAAPVRKTA